MSVDKISDTKLSYYIKLCSAEFLDSLTQVLLRILSHPSRPNFHSSKCELQRHQQYTFHYCPQSFFSLLSMLTFLLYNWIFYGLIHLYLLSHFLNRESITLSLRANRCFLNRRYLTYICKVFISSSTWGNMCSANNFSGERKAKRCAQKWAVVSGTKGWDKAERAAINGFVRLSIV